MGMLCFNSAAFSTSGGLNFAANADVEVKRESDGGLAQIYSDENGTALIAQPGFQTDAQGRFSFYAVGIQRGYVIKVTKGAETWFIHNVAMGTASFLDATVLPNGVLQDRAWRRARHFAALNYVF